MGVVDGVSRRGFLRLLGGGALLLGLGGCTPDPPGQARVALPPVVIDRLASPGQGPVVAHPFTLLPTYRQKVWLTGARCGVWDRAAQTPLSGLLSELTIELFDAARHRHLHGHQGAVSAPLFHLGADLQEIALPPGFGIPVWSHEHLLAQSVWQNRELYRRPTEAQAELVLDFVTSRDPQVPLRELRVHPLVLPGERAESSASGSEPWLARWVAPSGWSEQRAEVTEQLPPGEPLVVRCAVACLYPDWDRLELWESDTGTRLLSWEASVGASLVRSLPDGLSLSPGRPLELRVAYRNPSAAPHPVGAGLLLYADAPRAAMTSVKSPAPELR